MRHFQRSIPYLAGFLAEDRTEQTLLCGKLCLSLRSHLTYQDITCTHFRTDTDDSSLVQVLECIVAHTWDITGNLFRSQLGIAGFCLIFLNVDRCIHIVLHKSLT